MVFHSIPTPEVSQLQAVGLAAAEFLQHHMTFAINFRKAVICQLPYLVIESLQIHFHSLKIWRESLK
jgi:hypothetical protein